MPAATQPNAGGIISVRSKEAFTGAPGIAGFLQLIEPDVFVYEGKTSKNFKCQTHHNDEQIARLGEQIDRFVVEPLWAKFVKEAEAKGKTPPAKDGEWVKPTGAEWLDDQLKPPSERSKTQLPSITWKNAAEYKDRDGQIQLKTMKAYDPENTLLDLKRLNLGMGSVIQPLLLGGLYVTKTVKQPLITLKLQGVRVLKLVSFGGAGGSGPKEVSDEDLAGLGEGFEMDSSLGSYAASAAPHEKAPKTETREGFSSGGGSDFEEDEIPF